MNEETFNLQLRKFLKKVGVTSQREIERAVLDAIDKGKIGGTEKLKAKMTLEVPEVGVKMEMDDDIALE